MALDGLAVHALVNELSESLSGGKVDKIFQPERDKIILNIRNSNKNFKTLTSHDKCSIIVRVKKLQR